MPLVLAAGFCTGVVSHRQPTPKPKRATGYFQLGTRLSNSSRPADVRQMCGPKPAYCILQATSLLLILQRWHNMNDACGGLHFAPQPRFLFFSVAFGVVCQLPTAASAGRGRGRGSKYASGDAPGTDAADAADAADLADADDAGAWAGTEAYLSFAVDELQVACRESC